MSNAMRVEVELVKLSLCDCGFPLLKDEIKLGTKYFVNRHLHRHDGKLICGGCGKVIPFGDAVYVYSRGDSDGGFLPSEIFKATFRGEQ